MLCALNTAAKRLLGVCVVLTGATLAVYAQQQRPSADRSGAGNRAAAGADQGASPESKPLTFDTAIQHIVFIIKENRSFNEMFGAFEGITSGPISTGQIFALGVTPDVMPRDMGHTW